MEASKLTGDGAEAKTDPSPLMEALRKQLQSILEKPLTPRTLLELEQTARLSRDLLVVGKVPEARGATGLGLMASPGVFSTYGLGYGAGMGDGPYTSSPQSETFGATMVRELVAALPALMKPKEVVYRESAASLIDAITAAREAKMDDVVEKLKAKLDQLLAEPSSESAQAPRSGMAGPQHGPPFGGAGGAVFLQAEPIGGTIKVPATTNGASATEEERVNEVVLP